MANELNGLRVAILVTDGFEQVELTDPKKALDEAGAKTEIVSPMHGQVQGWNHFEKGKKFNVDVELNAADPDRYDALLLPGGVANPDQLRTIPMAVEFVKALIDEGKPVAAICHGPWMLVEADLAGGKTLTSWPSLKTDIRNAGGNWVDREVVVDGNIVTSRKPDDLPAFNREMLKLFQKFVPENAGARRRNG